MMTTSRSARYRVSPTNLRGVALTAGFLLATLACGGGGPTPTSPITTTTTTMPPPADATAMVLTGATNLVPQGGLTDRAALEIT